MTDNFPKKQALPHLVVCATAREIAERAAALFAQQAAQAIAERGRFRVALCGGTTPRPTYELLASSPWNLKISWEKVEVFWGDERYVSATDPLSNYRMVREALLDHVPVPPENIHRVPTEIHPAEAAAGAYEEQLRRIFGEPTSIPRFDLILLGLGVNGHTASLFPSSPLLRENQRLIGAESVREESPSRISMTAPLLNQARNVVFLVSGQNKAAVLREVIRGPYVPEALPAQLICPVAGELWWIVDVAAASRVIEKAS